MELEQRFADVEACREYLFHLRWPKGFICPRCEARPWGWAATGRPGPCSTSCRDMVRPGRDRLRGVVEVNETYCGSKEEGVVGRLIEEKALIIVAPEEDGASIGRVRVRCIPDLTKSTLYGFIAQSVEPGSTVRSDGLNAYRGLGGYWHDCHCPADATRGRAPVTSGIPYDLAPENDGCSVPIRVRSDMDIWTTTLMSSRSGSTAANQHRAGSCLSTSLAGSPGRPGSCCFAIEPQHLGYGCVKCSPNFC